jgi:hypothetical protein
LKTNNRIDKISQSFKEPGHRYFDLETKRNHSPHVFITEGRWCCRFVDWSMGPNGNQREMQFVYGATPRAAFEVAIRTLRDRASWRNGLFSKIGRRVVEWNFPKSEIERIEKFVKTIPKEGEDR